MKALFNLPLAPFSGTRSATNGREIVTDWVPENRISGTRSPTNNGQELETAVVPDF